MEVIVASPSGFCAGVERAIFIVEKAIEKYGSPVYVRHEIVHNKYVIDELKKKGAIFVEDIDEIPAGSITIFSAHGVSTKVTEDAKLKDLLIIDAVCPLVTKVHNEAIRNEEQGKQIILIGHANHPEVEGTSGRVKQKVLLVSNIHDIEKLEVINPDKLSYVTQTTLSVDDTKDIIAKLKEKFPSITGPELKDICYATQNRQNAVKELSKEVDLILVIGASNSSNSNRLRDLGQEMNIPSYLIDDCNSINLDWLKNMRRIGITAGASAPKILIDEVLEFFKNKFDANISVMNGVIENVKFKLPKEIL